MSTTTMRRVAMPARLKFAGSSDGALGDRQVACQVSSAEVDRQGDVVIQAGIDTSAFVKTGAPILWNHNPDAPVARAVWIGLDGSGNLSARAQFPPEGTSATADEVYKLIKTGIVSSTSIGFIPQKYEPLKDSPQFGMRITKCELIEFSFVATPANRDSVVTAKRLAGHRQGRPTTAQQRKLAARRIALECAALCAGYTPGEARHWARAKLDDGVITGDGPKPPSCGRMVDQLCGMKRPQGCVVHAQGLGPDCGRDYDESCRFLHAQFCTTHQTAATSPTPPTSLDPLVEPPPASTIAGPPVR